MIPAPAAPPIAGPIEYDSGVVAGSSVPLPHSEQVTTLRVPYYSGRVCRGGDIWEVSTRHLSCCINPQMAAAPALRASRFNAGRWQPHSLEDMFSAASQNFVMGADGTALPPLVIIYVHGNWMEPEAARERVRLLDSLIARQSRRPYQLIMLSWPSQRERGAVQDIRENAECADTQAHYVNYLMQRLSPTAQVSLVGFSFGGRTVTGALHLAAGGSINGYTSQCGAACSGGMGPKYRVVLVAPAVDRDWLTPTGRYNQAIFALDWMVNLYNSRDAALRRFRFINAVTRPIAAGFLGFEAVANPRAGAPLARGNIIQQYDCDSAVGPRHDESTYYSNCPYFRLAIDNLLWQRTASVSP